MMTGLRVMITAEYLAINSFFFPKSELRRLCQKFHWYTIAESMATGVGNMEQLGPIPIAYKGGKVSLTGPWR